MTILDYGFLDFLVLFSGEMRNEYNLCTNLCRNAVAHTDMLELLTIACLKYQCLN